MTTPQPIIDRMLVSLIAEAEIDDLDFASVISVAHRIQPDAAPDDIRQAVLDTVERAVSDNLLWPDWPAAAGEYFHYHP